MSGVLLVVASVTLYLPATMQDKRRHAGPCMGRARLIHM